MEPLDGIHVGDLEIRPNEHTVRALGHAVNLTAREFEILLKLAEHPGWTYSVDQLSGDAGGSDYSPESVSVLVSRIRKKLAAAGVVDPIETVRGVGYRLHGDPVTGEPDSLPADDADRELRDALWQLQEAVIDVERLGDPEYEREASELLEQARRALDEHSP